MTRTTDSDRDAPREPTVDRRRLLAAVGSGLATGLAGCADLVSDEVTDPEATPVVLYPPGPDVLGLEKTRVERLTRTVSPADAGEVEATSYLATYGHDADDNTPLPTTYDVTEPAAHAVGILAMPSPDVGGETLNPLAEKPFEELLVSDEGRKFLRQADAVESEAFEWTREPTRIGTTDVELLGTGTRAETYLGIASDGEDRTTFLMNLARVQQESDVVLVGEFLWRATPSKPLSHENDCEDEKCQLPKKTLQRFNNRFGNGITYGITCKQLARKLNVDIADLCSPGTHVPNTGPRPTFSVTDVRIVQQVENTRVVDPSTSPPTVLHQEPDPHLVEGENSAVVFEFDTIEHLGQMTDPLELAIFSGTSGPGTYQREGIVELSQSHLNRIENKGEDTVAVLHDISNPKTTPNTAASNNTVSAGTDFPTDHPVFDLETGDARISPVVDPLKDTTGVAATTSVSSNRIRQVQPLKVGFIDLQDHPPGRGTNPGHRYGDNNGLPEAPQRTFRSATEYLQRVYPGDVVTFHFQGGPVAGRSCLPDWQVRAARAVGRSPCSSQAAGLKAIHDDLKRAEVVLDQVSRGSIPGFPNRGQLRLDGRDRKKMVDEIRRNGFDVHVVILPDLAPSQSGVADYFDHWGWNWGGVAFANLNYAVSSLGARTNSNDAVAAGTVAQEIAHHFMGNYLNPTNTGPNNNVDHPMAQRRNVQRLPQPNDQNNNSLDPSHARHRNSNGVPGGDPPGVVSTGYDLKDGFATVSNIDVRDGEFDTETTSGTVPGVPSYMSYTDNDDSAWADARIHDQLIRRGFGAGGGGRAWYANGTAGSGDPAYMLTATGEIGENGGVRYTSVRSFEGYARYPDREDAPVRVELRGPDGETVESARVPARLRPTHGHGDDQGDDVHGGDGADREVVRAPSIRLPFATEGVEVRTSFEGQTTTMNPIDRSVRDAVGRVPPEGFRQEPETAREQVGEALDEVAAAMDAGDYEAAAAAMDGPVRETIREQIREYEAALDRRSRSELLALVDRMVERLESLAGG